MIEEIDSAQYVQHYFEKVYTELEHSPESFLRAALEFVQRQDALLSQPGAMESLVRLAEAVARQGGSASPASSPETAPPPAPDAPREAIPDSSAPSIPVPSVPSVEMPDIGPASPHVPEAEEGEEASSKIWRTYQFY